MKNFLKKSVLVLGLVCGPLVITGVTGITTNFMNDSYIETENAQQSNPIPEKYIVRLNADKLNFKKSKDYEETQEAMRKISLGILSKYNIPEENLGYVYGSSIEGFSVQLSDSQYEQLSKDEAVEYIEQDQIIVLSPETTESITKIGGKKSPAQVTPWGIKRVGGFETYSGKGKAFVIDTGIELTHPDLNVSRTGFNAFSHGREGMSPNDWHGHGTHVAGTLGAIDNAIGVVGVAAGVLLVPVKVLNAEGKGTFSGVIAGVNYVAAVGRSGDVANMSLGGGYLRSLNDAVIKASNYVKFALAAGNDREDSNRKSPASANSRNIYTISAMDVRDNYARFSNFGNPPVDYCAPGVNILSTWIGGGYRSISGTSMATPHVAGILLFGNINSDGRVNRDPDGNQDPIAVRLPF